MSTAPAANGGGPRNLTPRSSAAAIVRAWSGGGADARSRVSVGSPPALQIVVDAIAQQAVEHEPALRNMLRLSLEPDPARRADLPPSGSTRSSG